MEKKYQIREALGMYWILDMETDGLAYQVPPALNESGLFIWTRFAEGKGVEDVAVDVSREFGIDVGTAREDVTAFYEAMTAKGILKEERKR